MAEWLHRQENLIYLAKYDVFTLDEIFDKASWDKDETYFKCDICGKKFKYGDMLPLLEHIAKEHLKK